MLKEKTQSENELLKNIGKNITNILIKKNISVCELSKITGVSSACLYKVTWGETTPSIVVLDRICKALKVDLSKLCYDTISSKKI